MDAEAPPLCVVVRCLLAKNHRLVNSPVEYRNGQYLPDGYRFIAGHTPKTAWLSVDNGRVDYDQVFKCIAVFGEAPLIVKDFVKSQKHHWTTACYIPTAADTDNVRSVVDTFVALQGTDLNEGLVFREFVPLNDLAVHSKSGMPLTQEYRLFFLNKRLLGCWGYWEEGEYTANESPPLDGLTDIAKKVESDFFSMDVAKTKTGQWTIVELGDGQVSGLPDKTDRLQFHNLLQDCCAGRRV